MLRPLGVSDNRNRADADTSARRACCSPTQIPPRIEHPRSRLAPGGVRAGTGFELGRVAPSTLRPPAFGSWEPVPRTTPGKLASCVALFGVGNCGCGGNRRDRTSPHSMCGQRVDRGAEDRRPVWTEHRPIQIEAELRFPPFAHRAFGLSGTGAVDEAWKTRCRSRLGPGRCGSRTGRAPGDIVRTARATSPKVCSFRLPEMCSFQLPLTTSPHSMCGPRVGRGAEDRRPVWTEHRPIQIEAELRFPPFAHRALGFVEDRRRGRSVENAPPPSLLAGVGAAAGPRVERHRRKPTAGVE